ncbi:MAG TPA: CPBP family glutamic-type intramembrane protease, partial [Nitrososphaerales archaeon]|nr:CPBP family glutamic-type intramembrane protease [Nitrososphaerales archaeon]
LLSSDIVVAIVSIGFLTFTATAIDTVTQAAGVQIGELRGTDATIFISTTTSPLVEEFGFRMCIIGLVALALALGTGRRASLRALWRPASVYEGEAARPGRAYILLVALVASSGAFGLAHLTSGSGWDAGKLPEAVFGGLVLGYVYIRYGFHIAVLTHWGVDYLGTAYAFFGEGAHGIPWWSDPGYALQQIVTLDLVYGIGLFSFLLAAYLGVRRLGGARGPGDASPM